MLSECKSANAARAQMARTSLTIQENELRDRRGAGSAMRCNEILCVEELKRRAVARNLVRCRNQIIGRKGESGSVQYLTDVASRVWAVVMVQKREAGRDVKQHNAAKNGERLARELRGEKIRW
jgi:hypothetical protein